MQPNIPHHYDRRPTDYPRHKPPKYGWRDDNGKPIHAIDEKGTPICGRHRTNANAPCKQTILAQNGRCSAPGHGGNAPGAPPKHGRYSQFIPTRLAATYEAAVNDDVLVHVREDMALIAAMKQDKVAELGEESSGELWEKAKGAFERAQLAVAAGDEATHYRALLELGSILQNGSGIQQKEKEVLELMVKNARLTRVELYRLKKMDQFMTVEQSMAQGAQIIQIIKDHVPPSVCAQVATRLGLATLANVPRGA